MAWGHGIRSGQGRFANDIQPVCWFPRGREEKTKEKKMGVKNRGNAH